jgi:hypothetical protein
MITLTTPHEVNSVLGGAAPVAYNKLVLGPFTMDGVTQTITGTLRLTSTSTPTMQPIMGRVQISVPAAEVIVEVAQLDFYRRIVTTSAQNTAILNQIEAAQAQLENGLVSLGVVAGTRSAGV